MTTIMSQHSVPRLVAPGLSLVCAMAVSGCVNATKPSADYIVNGMPLRVSYHDKIFDPTMATTNDSETGIDVFPLISGYGVTRNGGEMTALDGANADEAAAYFCKKKGQTPSKGRFISNSDGPPLWYFGCKE